MMNIAVSPLMRSAGSKRKGQSFEKRRHGYIAQVGFQKSVHNTKQDVSFTVNLSVVNPEIVEQHFRAWMPAVAYWGTEIVLFPTRGQWHGRIGEFLGVGDRSRPERTGTVVPRPSGWRMMR